MDVTSALQGAQIAQLGHSARDLRLASEARSADSEEAAQKFEALFATMLVREMRRALPEGFFGGGSGAEIYEGWLDEHVGEALARDGGLQLAGMIKTNLARERAQEQATGDSGS